jgi:hypothetical protein
MRTAILPPLSCRWIEPGRRSGQGDRNAMQSARPRDLGALVLAMGVLLVLFVVSLTLGSPLR